MDLNRSSKLSSFPLIGSSVPGSMPNSKPMLYHLDLASHAILWTLQRSLILRFPRSLAAGSLAEYVILDDGDTVAFPSQILCLSASSLNTDQGWVVQVRSLVMDLVAGCGAIALSCFEHRKAGSGMELQFEGCCTDMG